MSALINQLATDPARMVLVLDDYHVITNPVIHGLLTLLLDHWPTQLTLILLTRTDPPLALARLRAKHELLELRAAHLRFSTDETMQFLNQVMELTLTPESVAALEARTEGWIAGLQLAALALQGNLNEAFIRDFTGSHRFVLDYLIEEVLSRQPESVRRFLLQTSLLRRLNGALCGALVDGIDGQAMLDSLERSNLFLVPLDQSRGWYRYHHLFADLLRARLMAEYPESIRELNARASRWHAAHHLPEEAIDYALAARDFGFAAQLIMGPARHVAERGEVNTLLDWYHAFPAGIINQHPQLGAQFGLAFALNGRWDEAEAILKGMEQRPPLPAEGLWVAYLVANYRHDHARLGQIEAEAHAMPPNRLNMMVLGLVASTKGEFGAACKLMTEAQNTSTREGDPVLALTAWFHRCRLLVFLGHLREAYETSQEALQRFQQLGNAVLPLAAFAHVSLGRIFIEWNELDRAAHHLAEAIRVAETSGLMTGMLSSATMMVAEVRQARGDVMGAAQAADKALVLAERYDPPAEVGWLKVYQVRLWLNQGNSSAAADWLRQRGGQTNPESLFYPPNIISVTRARILLVQRHLDDAVTTLTRVLGAERDLLTVEAYCLLAIARHQQGDHVHAALALEQALRLAEGEKRIRAFLDLGAVIGALLTRYCEAHPADRFAHHLLSLFPNAGEAPSLAENLSERELEVLRLIAAGLSNDEIAAKLTIALSTVKWYINSLYGKLHVKTRAQAIARAHSLNLIP